MREHKYFQSCFAGQDLQKPIPAHKLNPNWKLYPFVKRIYFVFHFAWFLGCSVSSDEQTVGFKGRLLYKIIIIYNNKMSLFQSDV